MRASILLLLKTTAVALRVGAAAVLVSCAWGNHDWRRESYATTVVVRGAGDGACSSPAPWRSLRACLAHDAAYALARRVRCTMRGDPDLWSEQARAAADYGLAAAMLADGDGELVALVYLAAVRWWGWPSWYLSCP